MIGTGPVFGGKASMLRWKMTRREEYEAKSEAMLAPIMQKHGFELVDVEYVKEAGYWYLRAYIDKEGGITVDDCEAVSQEFGELLDQEDFIEDSYILEVSSPGLGRPMKKDKDFERHLGEEVEGKLFRAVNGETSFEGTLDSYTKDTVTVLTEEDEPLVLERKNIALIRQALEF